MPIAKAPLSVSPSVVRAAAGSLSAAGAVVVNVLALETVARVKNSVVIASQDVAVTADTTGFVVAGAGGVAGTLAGSNVASSTSVGAGIAINVIANGLNDDGTLAQVIDSDIDAGGSINIAASSVNTIWAVAVGLAFNTAGSAQTANAVGVSVSTNVISTRTKAESRRKKNALGIRAGGAVSVTADDDSSINSISGAGAVASANTSNGVGASIALNVIANTVTALVIDTTVDAASLTVDAKSDDATIRSLGVAGALTNSFAVAAQLSLNLVVQNISASIESSTVLVDGSGGDVAVDAENNTLIQSLTGSAANAGGSNGEAIGAALSLNIIVASADAYIDNSSVTASDGSVLLQSNSTGQIDTIAVGVATAGQTALAGSLALSLIADDTRAYITRSVVDADRNLLVLADQEAAINSFGGAIGFSQQSNGVGGALNVNLITDKTLAYIENSTIHARANDTDALSIPSWSEEGNESTESKSGLIVIASSSQAMEFASGSLGGSTGAPQESASTLRPRSCSTPRTPRLTILMSTTRVTPAATSSCGLTKTPISRRKSVQREFQYRRPAWESQRRESLSLTIPKL